MTLRIDRQPATNLTVVVRLDAKAPERGSGRSANIFVSMFPRCSDKGRGNTSSKEKGYCGFS